MLGSVAGPAGETVNPGSTHAGPVNGIRSFDDVILLELYPDRLVLLRRPVRQACKGLRVLGPNATVRGAWLAIHDVLRPLDQRRRDGRHDRAGRHLVHQISSRRLRDGSGEQSRRSDRRDLGREAMPG
jgi:hypothetical protein